MLDRRIVARKEHRCWRCLGQILPGQPYWWTRRRTGRHHPLRETCERCTGWEAGRGNNPV